MPITTSAKKALRQNKIKNAQNLKTKKKYKDVIKNIQELVLEKKNKEAEKLLPKAYKAIDKAAKKGMIKKNTASRKKSRLTKLINRSKAVPKKSPKQA